MANKKKTPAEGKRLKISKAQQNMILAVLGASVISGSALAITLHFIERISFNAQVIMAKDEAIVAYSDTIKNVGICKKPKGKVYNDEELRKCDPNGTEVTDVPNTLRSNILEKLAADTSLNSMQRETDSGSSCVNPNTNKNYTYDELNTIYDEAETTEEITAATTLIKSCSALRVVADALPAQKNDEALLASLDKLFILSGQRPESLSPSGEKSTVEVKGLNSILISIRVNSDVETVYTVLDNVERSVRDFHIEQAAVEWNGANTLSFTAQAAAYYVDKSELIEVSKTLSATPQVEKGKKK